MISTITKAIQNKRPRPERYPARTLAALGGTLVDLSATGMRVKMHSKPEHRVGSVYRIEIRSSSQCVRLTARIVWIKRTGILSREHEIGLRFTDVQPAVGRVLEHWAIYGFIPSANNVASMPEVHAREATDQAQAYAQNRAAKKNLADAPCFYEALGLTHDACQAEIHAAYRKLAKRLHPDVSRDEDAADRFTYVARVYEVLGDPIKRERYDAAVHRRTIAA